MITYLTQFLRALEQAAPPAKGGRHVVTYETAENSDTTRDRLALLMWLETPAGPRNLVLYFENDDFSKPVSVLVAECILFAMRAVESVAAELKQPPAFGQILA